MLSVKTAIDTSESLGCCDDRENRRCLLWDTGWRGRRRPCRPPHVIDRHGNRLSYSHIARGVFGRDPLQPPRARRVARPHRACVPSRYGRRATSSHRACASSTNRAPRRTRRLIGSSPASVCSYRRAHWGGDDGQLGAMISTDGKYVLIRTGSRVSSVRSAASACAPMKKSGSGAVRVPSLAAVGQERP